MLTPGQAFEPESVKASTFFLSEQAHLIQTLVWLFQIFKVPTFTPRIGYARPTLLHLVSHQASFLHERRLAHFSFPNECTLNTDVIMVF